jgi:hypothetical protein
MTFYKALDVLSINRHEWVKRGLRMVNVNDVEEAMRVLFNETPYDWGGAIRAWERDKGP